MDISWLFPDGSELLNPLIHSGMTTTNMANATPTSPSASSVAVPPPAPRPRRFRNPRTEAESKPDIVIDARVNAKALFASPRWKKMTDRSHQPPWPGAPGEVSETLNRLLVEHDAEATLRCMQKDMHEERLKHLRQLQSTIGEDDWQYTPVEKLIGLQ